MGSSRPTDRSLGEGTFLPQWMKGKFDSRFDYTESTFSPPADDTFFYIPYPRHQETSTSNTNNKEGFCVINKAEGTSGIESAGNKFKDASNVDFSKHPISCQSFIPFANDAANEPKIIIANKPKVKYQTGDDEFRNAKTSECGRSIVHVANQIMSSKFGKSISSDAASITANQGDDSSAQQQRKVSKSLPATPIASPSGTPDSSPKSRRRAYGNRFFTGAFVPDGERYKNSWLLGSILGQSRELITPKIEEEDEQQTIDQIPARALNRKKSISSQNLTYVGKEEKTEKSQATILQAKPSELREMNFWSPTSM